MNKKKGWQLKRELIKHKYEWVLRHDGKIIEKKKWTSKKSVKIDVLNSFNQRKSLTIGRTNDLLSERTRNIEIRTGLIKPKKRKRYCIDITLTYGKKTASGSSFIDEKYSFEEKRKQAMKRAIGNLQLKMNKSYDGDETQINIEKGNVRVQESVRYYSISS